jgi:hypothetical protein
MAFRKIGDIYVSKAGNDSNPGTAAQPVLTIGKAVQLGSGANPRTIVVGTGTYEEAFDSSYIKLTMISDGVVVFKGNGTNTLALGLTIGFKIQDYAQIDTVQFQTVYWTDIDFINIGAIQAGQAQAVTMVRCKMINCDIPATSGKFIMDQCILVNTSTAPVVNSFSNSYTNGASTLRMNNNGGLDFSNIMGDISFPNGSSAGIEMSISDLQIAYPGLVHSCFNADPKFNNAAKQDFTLQSASPHIKTGSSGLNIGGTSYAKSITVSDAIAAGAILHQLELQGQDLVISTGYTDGYIIFPPQAIAANPQSINRIDFSGLLLFNKAAPGGSDTNKYVPDATVYPVADGASGDNPDRLVIEIRTSNNLPRPTQDADYDNNGYADPGTFIKVPINEQPFIDNFGRGNGEPNFDGTAYQPVVTIWVQPKVTLTNAYN